MDTLARILICTYVWGLTPFPGQHTHSYTRFVTGNRIIRPIFSTLDSTSTYVPHVHILDSHLNRNCDAAHGDSSILSIHLSIYISFYLRWRQVGHVRNVVLICAHDKMISCFAFLWEFFSPFPLPLPLPLLLPPAIPLVYQRILFWYALPYFGLPVPKFHIHSYEIYAKILYDIWYRETVRNIPYIVSWGTLLVYTLLYLFIYIIIIVIIIIQNRYYNTCINYSIK